MYSEKKRSEGRAMGGSTGGEKGEIFPPNWSGDGRKNWNLAKLNP